MESRQLPEPDFVSKCWKPTAAQKYPVRPWVSLLAPIIVPRYCWSPSSVHYTLLGLPFRGPVRRENDKSESLGFCRKVTLLMLLSHFCELIYLWGGGEKIFTTKKNEQKSVSEAAAAVNFQSDCDFNRRIGDTAIENAIDIVTDH